MSAESSSLSMAIGIRSLWARFFTFVKRPVLPPRSERLSLASLRAVLRLFALDVAAAGVLLAVGYAVMSIGLEMPKTAISGVQMSPALVALVVFGAPAVEEIVFRSWLSGRPGHLLAWLAACCGLLLAATLAASPGTGVLVQAGLAAAAVLAAGAFLFVLRHRDAIGWFAALFPLFYWLSAIGFAAAHLLNFGAGNLAMLLPLVLPQFVLALILGFARVNYGLWASILLHSLHNAAAISLALVATRLAG
jgi:membrane protease YdiL (CAAX protease family)